MYKSVLYNNFVKTWVIIEISDLAFFALFFKGADFEKDVEGNEARLDSINKMGEDLIEEGHSDADEIQRLCEVQL